MFDPNAWAQQVHSVEGEPLDDAQVDKLVDRVAVFQDGVPIFDDQGGAAPCVVRVNDLALSNPDWAKDVGHLGLARVLTACGAERAGLAPSGFADRVAEVMIGGRRRTYWPWVWAAAAAALGALLLARR